jgi:hypothetical protein
VKKNFKVAESEMTSEQKLEAMKLVRALLAKLPKEIACRLAIVAIPSITPKEILWLPSGLAKTLSGTSDPIGAVEQLLPKGNPAGFATLKEMQRLDLTV